MDFFEHQDRARTRTAVLVLYFVLALLTITALINLGIYALIAWRSEMPPGYIDWLISTPSLWLCGAVIVVMAGGSVYKLWQLRDGGIAMADLVGASHVPPDTPITDEHQLINIVEEMSIASGMLPPQVFIMRKEKAINAFVAGFRPTETVLVVTQGALDQLNRDELQGVIAHEFSHILNADCRLNLRLLAGLAGILALGKVGEVLLHGNFRVGRHGSGRSEVAGVFVLILAGLLMMVLGYVGLFFGRLIKAAISRQRELLADASSVQFTRNPAGIAGALTKIRNGGGSRLLSPYAEDMSHMCFGDTLKFMRLGGLLATHPPVDERLAAIGPKWLAMARVDARKQSRADAAQQSTAHAPASGASFVGPDGTAPASPARPAASQVGRVTPEHVGYARSILDCLPPEFRRGLHETGGAANTLLALAIHASDADTADLLPRASDSRVEQQVISGHVATLQQLGSRLRLPVLDLALATLKQLPADERQALAHRIHDLVRADRKVSLFEFALERLVSDHLAEHAGRRPKVRFHKLAAVHEDCRLLLSVIIHAGKHGGEEAGAVFRRAADGLLPASMTLLAKNECRLEALQASLARLQALSPLLKAPVIDACAFAVLDDGKVQVHEAELLRTFATLLDCPMPPLFTGDM
jgi:Zn-dependent protease with chaperone function